VAVVAGAALVAGPTIGNATTRPRTPSGIRLHLSDALAGKRTVHFGGAVVFAAPQGWVRTAVQQPTSSSSAADFRVSVAGGCTALAYVTPLTQATTASAQAQLRAGLPTASQLGIPVPPPVPVVETGTRAHSGAWELVAPPVPPDAATSPDGGYSFSYYGGVLVKVAHARWAGPVVGLTARPSTCDSRVVHDHDAKAALTHLLRTATLQDATVSR
jgi:hypothetical protein